MGRAGVASCVEFILGEADVELQRQREKVGEVELLLHDEAKTNYAHDHIMMRPLLKPGAVVMADNIYWPLVPGIQDYLSLVPKDRSDVLPIGKGISIHRV